MRKEEENAERGEMVAIIKAVVVIVLSLPLCLLFYVVLIYHHHPHQYVRCHHLISFFQKKNMCFVLDHLKDICR